MAIAPYKLEDKELLFEAQRTLENITATKYQKDVLLAVINRFMWHIDNINATNRWAQKVFFIQRRFK